jgi:hypothetical protein
MLNSFKVVFDYVDFEKKLRHYFTDTAPVYADIELRLNEINIISNGRALRILVDDKLSVKENIHHIIKSCEEYFYPRMLELLKNGQYGVFSEVQVKDLLFQGFTLEQIHEKEKKVLKKYFRIIRFNTAKDSIDFIEESTGNLFRAHFKRPLITSRDNILRLAGNGQMGMNELFHLITDNSRIEELEGKDAEISADFN